jgi:hypothetical protein
VRPCCRCCCWCWWLLYRCGQCGDWGQAQGLDCPVEAIQLGALQHSKQDNMAHAGECSQHTRVKK